MGFGSLAGMEVPIVGSDCLKWIEVSVVSSLLPNDAARADTSSLQRTFAPPTEDAASCHLIGDPPVHLIWRIHKKLPCVLELVELSACEEFPTIGLRLMFQDALCPFAFICKDEIRSSSENLFLLYTLTVSGVAYLFRLKNVCHYASCSVFPEHEFQEFNLQTLIQSSTVTVVAATEGCLVVGRHDGLINCILLGMADKNVPGFVHELRDDGGIGRIWGLMSRGRSVGPVQDLVISEVHGRKLLFVLHMDGSLRVWDLSSHSRVLNHIFSPTASADTAVSRLWVADVNYNSCLIFLAILYHKKEIDERVIVIYGLRFNHGDKITLALEPSMQNISLGKSGIIDLKITTKKLWMLKEDGLMMYNISFDDDNSIIVNEVLSYGLYEAFLADQLFQGSEHSLDDLVWTSQSLFSSMKENVLPFVSSIFLRRLLQPGVHQNVVLLATIKDYGKQWTDANFLSLTVDSLRKEIVSIIESEGVGGNQTSVSYWWRNFCTHYFHHWCQSNTPYSLFLDTSTGAVGLVRQNSISLFRGLEDIEMLMYGSFDELGDFVSSGLDLPDNTLDREILFELLRCASSLNQQLGKAAAAIFCESLISAPIVSSEEIVPHLLKILETGYSSAVSEYHISQLGSDTAWKKEVSDHKNQRKFSVEMLLSLHSVYGKAKTWARVLNNIENYLKFLVPRKSMLRMDTDAILNINASIMIQSASQVAKVMFESALDILLLLGYLVNISGQVHMAQDDISRIQLELVPLILEILTEWLILYFLGTTSCESLAWEDFSSRLSSLHIDSNNDKRSWKDKLGTCNFTLGSLLFLNRRSFSEDQTYLSSCSFPSPNGFISSVQNFISSIIWGLTQEESASFFSHSTELAVILLKHGQYEAVEDLLAIIDIYSFKEKTSQSVQSTNGEWCRHLHILGLCLLARAHSGLQGNSKERKVREAVRCFFRASSCQGASNALQSLSIHGLPLPDCTNSASGAAWKLHYYQWAMQTFEQYNMSDGACQFALAALEQVDEVLGSRDSNSCGDLHESASTMRGRLWANVFKFTLDLYRYYEAYCAIISNPDEGSKYICLRRFIIVLIENGASKIFCDGGLPFVELIEKVEQELAWKAERSEIAAKPNPYKLLYSFEMHRHNWRKAASYIYHYSARLRAEMVLKEQHLVSILLQERLNGLSAAINALNLVHPAYAWIDPQLDGYLSLGEHYPNKKARKIVQENALSCADVQYWRLQYYVDIEKLEKEFVLTSAEYFLSTAVNKYKITDKQALPSELVEQLVQANLYDMAFTIILKFWKGSKMERELERVFIAMSMTCCPNRVVSPFKGNKFITNGLLLTSAKDDTCPSIPQPKGSNRWEMLELYLGKYRRLHSRLPTIVAETLLHTDPQIELPLWLVHMLKGGRRATAWGMTGRESDPASLFRLYVNYGRFTEATNLLLEYIDSFASLKPANIISRKKMSAIWFPYTTIEHLWCQLEELQSSGHMTDQCDKLRRLLRGALTSHLKQVEVDSHDAVSSAAC